MKAFIFLKCQIIINLLESIKFIEFSSNNPYPIPIVAVFRPLISKGNFERARPFPFCKGHFQCKSLKSMGHFWRGTKSKTRGIVGHGLSEPPGNSRPKLFFLCFVPLSYHVLLCKHIPDTLSWQHPVYRPEHWRHQRGPEEWPCWPTPRQSPEPSNRALKWDRINRTRKKK